MSTKATSGVLGGQIYDFATLQGGNAPTGTITWNVYAANTRCATSLGTVTDSVNGNGTYKSPGFSPSATGEYKWVASYSGDANNLPVSSACNDRSELSEVEKALPYIVTSASSNIVGQPVVDVAIFTYGDAPTGTLTWQIFAANTGCATPLATVTDTVSGNGTYTSPAFTPTSPGVYQWVASYSGDATNSAVSTKCKNPFEQSTVTKATPSIATSPTSNTAGQPIHDVATLSGGDTPTGSITWYAYAANTGCTSALFTGSKPVSGDGTYTSPDFTPQNAGTYQWVASYSGDANNNSVTSSCTDQSEQSTAAPVKQTVAPVKQAIRPIKIVRCARGKVKKHKRSHGHTITVCVAKHHVSGVTRRRVAPAFTG